MNWFSLEKSKMAFLYWFWKLWCTDCCSISCLEPKARRMHFWQGTDKYNDGKLKYQNENINKPEHKRKLWFLELFLLFKLELKFVCFYLI